MFTAPSKEVPVEVAQASDRLNAANMLFQHMLNAQKTEFKAFWYNESVLRSKEEINAMLAAMDAVSPGQSSKYFTIAKQLVDFLLAIDPFCIRPFDWMPPYEYEVDPVTFSLRMK